MHSASDSPTVPCVVLDHIEPGWTPPYCTHGRATCVAGCGEWVWLGHQTYEEVWSGRLAPICKQCAQALARTDPEVTAAGRVADRLRCDGPHDRGLASE